MEKYKFKKSYSRDCSIILEEAWFEAQTSNFENLLDELSPFGVPNVYVVTGGVLEIWENEKTIEWNKNRLLQVVSRDADLINRTAQEYQKNIYKTRELLEV